MNEQCVHLNGELVPESKAQISMFDRGFTLADGIFETMVSRNGDLFRLNQHMDRLDKGCDLLGIQRLNRRETKQNILELLHTNKLTSAVIRLTVTRGVDRQRGLTIHDPVVPTILIRTHLRSTHKIEGISLGVSSIARNEGSPISGIKSISYSDSIVAKKLVSEEGFDDALLLNNLGNVACATSSNFFVTQDNTIITPPLSDGVLGGIIRGVIFEISSKFGLKIIERSFKPNFDAYEESFITNVVTGIVPVVAIDKVAIGSGHIGPIVKRLSQTINSEM
tara:strand:+ start:1080 stop:1916 length:837 start_codon:yes stop_codon:yes gene_type:complete